MKKNILKKALSDNMLTIGSWVTLSHPIIPELLSDAGFDWLVVDMEHSSIDINEVLSLIISIEFNKMVPLVRVGENNPNLIKRVMDAGAYGVIVPNVNTAENAIAAVSATKYPPQGSRGVGLYRAQRYGRNFDQYRDWLSKESVVIIQIEHISAVNNIESILSTPGIDALMVGPYDLSASLGKPGIFDDQEFVSALSQILSAAERHSIPAGIHSVSPDPQEARRRIEQGYKFLAFGMDTIFLADAAYNALHKVRIE